LIKQLKVGTNSSDQSQTTELQSREGRQYTPVGPVDPATRRIELVKRN